MNIFSTAWHTRHSLTRFDPGGKFLLLLHITSINRMYKEWMTIKRENIQHSTLCLDSGQINNCQRTHPKSYTNCHPQPTPQRRATKNLHRTSGNQEMLSASQRTRLLARHKWLAPVPHAFIKGINNQVKLFLIMKYLSLHEQRWQQTFFMSTASCM